MCTDEKLNPTLLAGLEAAMEQNWTNIRHPSGTKVLSSTWSYDDTALWSHEWHNHGTCTGMDQYTYFSTALQLLVPTPAIVKERYSSNGGGVVTRSELLAGYSFTTAAASADSYLVDDLKGEKETILICSEDGYLSEVTLCYEKKTLTYLHDEKPKCHTDEACNAECLKQREVCHTVAAATNVATEAAAAIDKCKTDTDQCLHKELQLLSLPRKFVLSSTSISISVVCAPFVL